MSEYNKMPLLMDLSRKDKFGVSLSDIDVPLSNLPESTLLREDIQLPELSQLDVRKLRENRYKKFRQIGSFLEPSSQEEQLTK